MKVLNRSGILSGAGPYFVRGVFHQDTNLPLVHFIPMILVAKSIKDVLERYL